MFDVKKLEASLDAFLKDKKWSEYFYDAPSGAKEVIAISFYRGHNPDEAMDEDIIALLNEARSELDEEDIRYLAERCPNAQARSAYAGFGGDRFGGDRSRQTRYS